MPFANTIDKKKLLVFLQYFLFIIVYFYLGLFIIKQISGIPHIVNLRY